jgi:hypothetical protein
MKTNELTGAALDWAVAKCEERITGFNLGGGLQVRGRTEEGAELPDAWDLWYEWHPSTDWEQGGPIIEREGIAVRMSFDDEHKGWTAIIWAHKTTFFEDGPTPLIAAMRCYVASKLGDEVEIPEELK